MNRENNVFYWLPCSVVFVSTAHGEMRDIMTATAMFVSEKEPLLAISVAQGHLTEKLIRQSAKFTLVIAGDGQKELAIKVGSVKGDAADKFQKFSIKSIAGTPSQAPIPDGAAAWMVCNVESSHEIKGYRIFVGRVVAQQDTGKPPLVWHKDAFFALKPV
ncbi:MAG: flavin reductase family protein [Desulfobacterales bacterium]|nr:MAG: flavin reductase family protein [Desulfobacterales bacterium]